MKSKHTLRYCNIALLTISLPVIATSIQLEATSGTSVSWVWCHIISATIFLALACIHFYLNRNARKRTAVIRVLAIAGLLVIVSAIAATAHWASAAAHSGIGGVHGKFGFLFLILAAVHTIRHRAYYKNIIRLRP